MDLPLPDYLEVVILIQLADIYADDVLRIVNEVKAKLFFNELSCDVQFMLLEYHICNFLLKTTHYDTLVVEHIHSYYLRCGMYNLPSKENITFRRGSFSSCFFERTPRLNLSNL